MPRFGPGRAEEPATDNFFGKSLISSAAANFLLDLEAKIKHSNS